MRPYEAQQVALSEDDHVVQDLAPERADETLRVTVLPGRLGRDPELLDTEMVHAGVERRAVGSCPWPTIEGLPPSPEPSPIPHVPTLQLGYPTHAVFGIGVVLAACVIAYVVPRTSLLGAILLTGYLGGAIATHVRVDDPLWTHTLFPVYVAAVIWAGLVLRDARLRNFLKTWFTR